MVALTAVLWGKVEGKFLRGRATATAVAIVLSVGEGPGLCQPCRRRVDRAPRLLRVAPMAPRLRGCGASRFIFLRW